jgi:mono/diheme cytochrome c family protein
MAGLEQIGGNMQFLENARTLAMVIVTLLPGPCAHAQVNGPSTPAQKAMGSKDVPVTTVSGESWLAHLNRSFNETSMGKTGHLGPPAPAPGEQASQWQHDLTSISPSQTVTLHGSDLYRLNCQGCHGESGRGAPPEINSVISPVRATSVALVMERMNTAGMDISRTEASKLAQQANAALLERLHKGGKNMPPLPHLSELEIRALVAYLNRLAGVPGAEARQIAVSESPLRIGEHIVKSTCHTCHSATGPDPDAQQLWDGAIPPLSALTTRKSRAEFTQKVTHGAPILMGAPPMLYRGRMPVFYYLSEQEAADVYLYLTQYPPSEGREDGIVIALMRQCTAGRGTPPTQKASGASFVADNRLAEVHPPSRGTDLQTMALLGGVVAFVVLLLAGGLGFTMHEFQRLSARSQGRNPVAKTKLRGRTEDAPATFQHVS